MDDGQRGEDARGGCGQRHHRTRHELQDGPPARGAGEPSQHRAADRALAAVAVMVLVPAAPPTPGWGSGRQQQRGHYAGPVAVAPTAVAEVLRVRGTYRLAPAPAAQAHAE